MTYEDLSLFDSFGARTKGNLCVFSFGKVVLQVSFIIFATHTSAQKTPRNCLHPCPKTLKHAHFYLFIKRYI